MPFRGVDQAYIKKLQYPLHYKVKSELAGRSLVLWGHETDIKLRAKKVQKGCVRPGMDRKLTCYYGSMFVQRQSVYPNCQVSRFLSLT